MNREISRLDDLKLGKKYKLTTFPREYMVVLEAVGTGKKYLEYKFKDVQTSEIVVLTRVNFAYYTVYEIEYKPAIEMLISGVDSLLDITDEPSILNLSLYGIISVGGTITIRKAKES